MVNFRINEFLTEKLFAKAKRKENHISKKHRDNIVAAGFSDEDEFVIVGEKFFYEFNETKSEQKHELHAIFTSEWKKELHYGFGEFYSERLNKENRLYVRFLMGLNSEKCSESDIQQAKDIGFSKRNNISCQKDDGNFLYKDIILIGRFIPKQKGCKKLKNEFPIHDKFDFAIKKASKLPKIMAYAKAIVLLPFSLLLDLLIAIVFYGVLYLIYAIFKLKDWLVKD